MSGDSPGEITEVRYLIRPNRSMDGRQAALVVLLVAAVSFVLAGGLALRYGAWPILPFAGLEVGMMAYVVWRVQTLSDNEEVLVLGDSWLDLTCRRRGHLESHRFSRYFVRVNLHRPRARNFRSRLEIGSHGKFVEIGAFLTDDERLSLAENLTARLAGAAAIQNSWKSTGESRR